MRFIWDLGFGIWNLEFISKIRITEGKAGMVKNSQHKNFTCKVFRGIEEKSASQMA